MSTLMSSICSLIIVCVHVGVQARACHGVHAEDSFEELALCVHLYVALGPWIQIVRLVWQMLYLAQILVFLFKIALAILILFSLVFFSLLFVLWDKG